MLQPVVRRNWAPKGKTPLQYSWDRHDRLSVVAGITVSPMRHHLRLYFQIHCRNINFEKVMEFIVLLHRNVRRKLILVMDRYSAHRKAVMLLQEAHPDWFEVEWLPAYAPNLNAVEMVWNHSKYGELANFLSEDVDDLRRATATSLENMSLRTRLMRSFYRYTRVEL